MEAMEHNDAVRLQAVEKYILGELPPTVRDEFEAHYFDCAVCSFNLRAGIAFATGTRQFFAEVQAPVPLQSSRPVASGWLAWLKPAIALPVFAALLLVIGYQNVVTIPQLHQAVSSEETAVGPWFSLVVSDVRGAAGSTLQITRGQGFLLLFDITAAHSNPDANFIIQLTDASGKIVLSRTVSGRIAQKSVQLSIPPGMREGQYHLLILQKSGITAAPVGEIPFTIAFSSEVEEH
jgi:Putative zinc-finger